MDFKQLESQTASHSTFMYDTIYFQSPDEYASADDDGEDEWVDEEDENFDDEVELDELNSARMGDDLELSDDAYDITNPDPDDDHLPEEELQ